MSIFWQQLIINIATGIATGGLAATIIGFIFNNRLDRSQRVMNARKEIYSKVHESLSGLFTTADNLQRQEVANTLLPLFRQVQLWGSPKVVKNFNKFLVYIDKKNNIPQKDVDLAYKTLIVSMRNDLVGDKFKEKDLHLFGRIGL